MPANFPEIWVKQVRQNLTAASSAPWLDGIPEIDAPVIELGAGSASEANVIHIPTTMFKPDVLINNTTYPIAVQPFADDQLIIGLDKYQTLATSVSDDQVIGAAYDRINAATKSHTDSILEKKYAKAIHAMAPNANAVKTPVLLTTGEADSTGRKRLIYDDFINFKEACDAAGMDKANRRFVPCSNHYNDMLRDRKQFGDMLVNYAEGTLAAKIAGFTIFLDYQFNPYFNGTNKVPFASVAGAGTHQASVAFALSNVGKRTGLTKQYYAPAGTDPKNQTNLLNYRHYFIALPFGYEQIGAMNSGQA